MNDLNGKLAVVTGGASGIGFAIASRLAAQGAQVTLVGRSQDKLDEAAGRIGRSAQGVKADVERDADVEALFTRFERVHILVTCAGGTVFGPVTEVTPQDARDLFAARVFGQISCAHFAVPRMGGDGTILFCSGIGDVVGLVPYGAGSAVDGAVNAFARSLAVELGPQGIRVNAVSPGIVGDTAIRPSKGADLAETFTREALKVIPLRRAGTAEDVADAALFLIASPYITGQVIEIDGGWAAT